MCYRCEICQNVAPSGQHLLRHTIYRDVPARTVIRKVIGWSGSMREAVVEEQPRTEIKREIALCQLCYDYVLEAGLPEVIKRRMVPLEQEIQVSRCRPMNRLSRSTNNGKREMAGGSRI